METHSIKIRRKTESRWEDEVLKDIKEMNIKNWLNVVKEIMEGYC